jgi:hypothetical protein
MTESQESAANVRWRYLVHGIFSVQHSRYYRSKMVTLLLDGRPQMAGI